MVRVVSAESGLVVTALVGGSLITGLVAVGAQMYAEVEDGLAGFDRPVLDQAVQLRTLTSTRLLTGFTTPVGRTIIATAVTVFMVLLAVAGSSTMTTVGKAVVGRARPPLSPTWRSCTSSQLAPRPRRCPPYEGGGSAPDGGSAGAGWRSHAPCRCPRGATCRGGPGG